MSLERLYQRLGLAYVLPILVFAALIDILDVGSFTILGTRYLGLDQGIVRGILTTALIGSSVGLLVTFALVPVFLRDLVAWIAGPRTVERAPGAWQAATTGLTRLIYLGVCLVALGDMPAIIRTAQVERFGIEIVFVVGAAAAATFAGGLVILVAAEIWARPIIDEIGRALPRDFQPTGGRRPIGRRLRTFIVLVSFLSPFYAVGVIGQQPTGSGRVVGTMVASIAIALTFGLLFSFAIARSIGSPVGQLVRATRRVRAGSFDAHVVPVANDELGELTRSFNEMVAGLAEREALHSALGTYVDPVVADRLMSEGQVLEGEEVDVTVMFVDIVAFTSRVENMEPAQVVAELNEFFQLVIPIVNRFGGHTNKLLGDGFMAVYGAPVVQDDHADRALAAAQDIREAVRARYGEGLRAGIGLNSGKVIVGTTGGASKLDFTVIGDAVNVASRVEALTRETGDDILLTAETRGRLRSAPPLLERGTTTVKGRVAAVEIFGMTSDRTSTHA